MNKQSFTIESLKFKGPINEKENPNRGVWISKDKGSKERSQMSRDFMEMGLDEAYENDGGDGEFSIEEINGLRTFERRPVNSLDKRQQGDSGVFVDEANPSDFDFLKTEETIEAIALSLAKKMAEIADLNPGKANGMMKFLLDADNLGLSEEYNSINPICKSWQVLGMSLLVQCPPLPEASISRIGDSILENMAHESRNYKDFLGNYVLFRIPLHSSIFIKALDLLEFVGFHKTYFLRIVSQAIAFIKAKSGTGIDPSLVSKICEVARQQKLDFVIKDLLNILIARETVVSPKALSEIIYNSGVSSMKLNETISLIRLWFKKSKDDISFEVIQRLCADMVQNQKDDTSLIFLFESVRDMIKTKRLPAASLANASNQEIVKLQEEFKKKQEKITFSFYQNFIFFLLRFEKKELAQMVFFEERQLGKTSTVHGYINGFTVLTEKPEMFEQLYEEMKANEKVEVSHLIVLTILDCVKKNPKALKPVFEKVMEEFVYSQEIPMSTFIINRILSALTKVRDSNFFITFLRYLDFLDRKYHPKTKVAAFRFFNMSTDEMSQSTIKGLLDKVFEPK